MNHRVIGAEMLADMPLAGQPAWLRLDNVGYTYPNGRRAVGGVSFDLGPGILGLLGPNGAGKSTLMRLLATLTRPSEGRILWQGVDTAVSHDPLRLALGYLPQSFGVYPALTAREFLHYLAAVKGLPRDRLRPRVDACLGLVGLEGEGDRQIGGFSGGMRQRIGIAQALLNDPKLLIVDEPTVGLDPEERLRFRHLLTELAGQRLVILSTHIVPDIEASATTIAVLDHGHLRFFGASEALLAQAEGRVWECTVPSSELAEIRARGRVTSSLRRPDGVRVRIVADTAPSPDAQPVTPGLEDAYLHLLG